MSRIRIGQIGMGHAHAAGKMQVYRQSADFEVVGVVEPDEELRRQAQKTAVYSDLQWMSQEELLATPGLKAVAVETRVKDLLPAAQACIDAGMHIHLDKPAGSDLKAFERLLDSAAKKHLAVQMGYMYRFNPAVVLLREFLKNDWLGDVFEVHAVMSKVIPPAQRAELAEYPGGMMFELGCHLIDLVVGILGEPERVRPFARHSADIDDGLLDNQLAVLEYPRALASVKTTAMEVDGFARRHLVLCGTNGTFHIQPLDAPSVRFVLAQPRGGYPKGRTEKDFGGYARYVGDAQDLARIIRGEKDSEFTYDHDLSVQRTVLRASGLSPREAVVSLLTRNYGFSPS